jgi:hypothetical protein
MSVTQQPLPPEGMARGKAEEDDHDLLTFTEAGERLRVEIAAAAASVAELEKSGPHPELDKARARLAALRAAAQRNAAQPINDANFEKFFGYPGKAKRNLPDPPPSE